MLKYIISNKITKRIKKKKVIQADRVRVYTNKTDWWLIRSSNTKPAMTARAEAMSPQGLELCKKELKKQLNLEGFDIKFE